MSRIGKLPITIPDNISVSLKGSTIYLDNKKEKKHYTVSSNVLISCNNNIVLVKEAKKNCSNSKKNIGMDRSNINNLVLGLTNPFKIVLEIIGVGYKFSIDKSIIVFSLGYSHDIIYCLPDGVEAKSEGANLLALYSSDKILVGQISSEIISFRKPEPYKGKGINIKGRYILRKEGKKK